MRRRWSGSTQPSMQYESLGVRPSWARSSSYSSIGVDCSPLMSQPRPNGGPSSAGTPPPPHTSMPKVRTFTEWKRTPEEEPLRARLRVADDRGIVDDDATIAGGVRCGSSSASAELMTARSARTATVRLRARTHRALRPGPCFHTPVLNLVVGEEPSLLPPPVFVAAEGREVCGAPPPCRVNTSTALLGSSLHVRTL